MKQPKFKFGQQVYAAHIREQESGHYKYRYAFGHITKIVKYKDTYYYGLVLNNGGDHGHDYIECDLHVSADKLLQAMDDHGIEHENIIRRTRREALDKIRKNIEPIKSGE